MQILGLFGMYFDAVVVEVKTFLLLFRLALAILCSPNFLKKWSSKSKQRKNDQSRTLHYFQQKKKIELQTDRQSNFPTSKSEDFH